MANKLPNHTHNGHRERMRLKLDKNRDHTLADHELVEMLLYYLYPRCDTNARAHKLLDAFGGSITNLIEADKAQLKSAGLTDVGASFFNLLREVYRSYSLGRCDNDFSFTSMETLLDYSIGLINNSHDELFYVICFDAKNKRINDTLVASGGVKNVDLSVRNIVDIGIKNNASSVVLVHNHPNGILNTSVDDIIATQHVERALKIMGINLADHIIVASGKAISMREEGGFDAKVAE